VTKNRKVFLHNGKNAIKTTKCVNAKLQTTSLTPMAFEELPSGRNFTAPGSPCHKLRHDSLD